MKRLSSFSVSIVMILGFSMIHAQNNDDFQEPDDPTSDTLSNWQGVSDGLHASFVTRDKRFAKHIPPKVDRETHKHLKGWKGERVSAQVLLWTNADIADVKVTAPKFKDKTTGKTVKGQVNFERYVLTDEFACGCGYRDAEDFASSLSPDMLDPLDHYNMEGESVRPVWISVDIPRDIEAETYQSTIEVKTGNQESQALTLQMEVVDHELPKPKDWTFHLDLWQHPAAVARVNDVDLWSDAHFEAMKPVMQRLADAGQKVITATLNKDPWDVQTYDPYDDMIIWAKDDNGNWHYDYTVFDKWVEFMLDLGIDGMINAYSILPWNDEIHYKDDSGEFVDVEAGPGSGKFKDYWKPFLKDFSAHLKKKGWLEKTNIALDERPPEQMEAVFDLIDEVAPELGVSYADNHKTYQDYPGSEDISIAADDPFDHEDLKEREAKGLNTSFYIYCGNEFMNTFTFSNPAEANYVGWYALANGFDGVLRWSYNSWTEHPFKDSRFRTWPAGDTYIVYPQNRSSIRFERLREGIQDYEKARIIRQYLKENNKKEKLEKLNKMIDKLGDSERPEDWNQNLNAAKEQLNSF